MLQRKRLFQIFDSKKCLKEWIFGEKPLTLISVTKKILIRTKIIQKKHFFGGDNHLK